MRFIIGGALGAIAVIGACQFLTSQSQFASIPGLVGSGGFCANSGPAISPSILIGAVLGGVIAIATE